MRTLYTRNVPDDLMDRLERMAAADGLSVNAVVIRELSESTRRVDNAALLQGLPDLGLDLDEVAEVIREGRGDR
ncbi:MAG: antitoxin [Thermoleophilia bacterium]